MPVKLTRREFLKVAAAFSAVLAGGGQLLNHVDRVVAASAEVPRLIPTLCGMCEAHCGVLAYTQRQTLLKLEGNFRHSHSAGKICPRGVAGARMMDDPDRLKTPLKRVGDKFQPISWQVALAEIGERLTKVKERLGPQGIAWLRHPDISDAWDQQFMRALGSPNIFSSTPLGRTTRNAAAQVTLGDVPFLDHANAHYILIFGRNMAESIFTADLTHLAEAKEHGAHVVVFDPRLTNTAAFAHEWVPIKPGTDGALLLAIMNVLISEKLYDANFVDKQTVGFAQLADYVLDKTPGWASHITDVAADTIRRVARELAANRPNCGVEPSWRGAWGGSYGNSFQAARAVFCLNALLGNYGAPGGLLFTPKANLAPIPFPSTPAPTVKRVDGVGNGKFPLASLADGVPQLLPEIILSGKPYPIGALIVNHANPARSLPNSRKVEDALRKLDLLVAIDVQMSETAELAHYVLPESSYLERDDPLAVSQRGIAEIALRQLVVIPRYDTRAAHQIIADLAKSIGLESAFGVTAKQSIALQFKSDAPTAAELDKSGVWQNSKSTPYGVPTFGTPSGKIELASDALKKLGIDPAPVYESPRAEPGLHQFRLLTGHEFAHTGTSTQNNRYLAALSNENQLWIHPARALRLGIENDSWVVVTSATGSVRVKAKLTEGIYPEAVWLTHGYGHGTRKQQLAFDKGANDNFLIQDQAEPIAGASLMNENLVTVGRG